MRVKLYRINEERDIHRVKFSCYERTVRYQKSTDIDSRIYDLIFSGEVDCESPSELYTHFNRGYVGCRMFASDVAEVTENEGQCFYFCDLKEMRRIDFDADMTQPSKQLIRILVIEPNRKPYEAKIKNTLENLQGIVGGEIECTDNYDGTLTVVNANGKNLGLEGCRRMDFDIIAGTFFIVGDGGEQLCSLGDVQMKKYSEMFARPERITHAEVEECRTLSLR